MKTNIVFEKVDIIDFMKKVVDVNTSTYKTDLEIDLKFMRLLMEEEGETHFLFMSRTHGTELMSLKEVFSTGTSRQKRYLFYANPAEEHGEISYLFEIKNQREEKVYGDVYYYDPKVLLAHVKERRLGSEVDSYFTPDNEEYLKSMMLSEEKRYQNTFSEGDVEKHLKEIRDERLSKEIERIKKRLDVGEEKVHVSRDFVRLSTPSEKKKLVNKLKKHTGIDLVYENVEKKFEASYIKKEV